MYSEEQRRYRDFSDRDLLAVEKIQCNSAADSFAMNGCVCIPKRQADTCVVEEYLTSSHCFLPSMCCCKLLENILYIMTLLHMHDALVLPKFNQYSQ